MYRESFEIFWILKEYSRDEENVKKLFKNGANKVFNKTILNRVFEQ